MNKKKIIIGIFSVAVFIGIYTSACIYQSRKYPDPVLESVEAGEEITFDEYKYNVIEAGFVKEEDVHRLWEKDIQSLEDVRVVYVRFELERIADMRDNSKTVQLSDFTLVTDTYNQAADMTRYAYFNSPEEMVKTHNNIGDKKEVCLIFTIPKIQFTDKQWDEMKISDFKLHISRYPVIKEIRLS
ncbi:MAG: hypothetical protein ACI4D1_04330 [Lachnospira sp.]